MNYSILMGAAAAREDEIAARTRLPRLDSVPATTRRTGKRGRRRVATEKRYA